VIIDTHLPDRTFFLLTPFHLNLHKPYRAILISFDALKAIAHGLGVIEGDLVKAQLMNLYHQSLRKR
jgi:hypothetical protein